MAAHPEGIRTSITVGSSSADFEARRRMVRENIAAAELARQTEARQLRLPFEGWVATHSSVEIVELEPTEGVEEV